MSKIIIRRRLKNVFLVAIYVVICYGTIKKTGFFFIKNNTPGFEFGLEKSNNVTA